MVDNNSHDHSVEMVKEKFPWVKLIANKENTGFSVANNQAIRQSKGEYVLLLNPDTVVEEDTFTKSLQFMDKHPNAGGLGVKMIDGKGNFLPESKRALPTAKVAFFKAFGLSAVFPKSRIFARYHLGFLDENKTHKIEILAGAYMLMRKKVLDEIGLLDETFFMYGEDIDLSYRIIKAGYDNYYFPETQIIHYKGESTKKGSLNYVKVFYEAMLIFARKHFSPQQAKFYSFAIYFAIFIKGSLTLVQNFIQKMAMPFFDFFFSLLGIFLLKDFWATQVKTEISTYPKEFTHYILPIYVLVWLLFGYIGGAYQLPYKTRKIFKSIGLGTLFIAAFYGFLPENLRFSRAIILMGAAWTFLAMLLNRLVFHIVKYKKFNVEISEKKNVSIIGNRKEAERVLTLLKQTSETANFVGFVDVNTTKQNADSIGNLEDLEDLISVYQINELIFCAKDVSAKSVIKHISTLGKRLSYKIVPPESLSIIGSDSKNTSGDLYAIDVNLKIGDNRNRQLKRLFDLLSALFLLSTLVVNIWFVQNKLNYIKNIIKVLIGKKTWIGYAKSEKKTYNLPTIKPSVITPITAKQQSKINTNRVNLLYAKNYSVENDFFYLIKLFKHLGK